MNQLEYVSVVASAVHEELESWARNLLREAGIETTEVYGQFPPEGSVASHIVLFPYRISSGDSHLAQPKRETSLLGPRAQNLRSGSIPPAWLTIGKSLTQCIQEQFPKMEKGPFRGRPHPAPSIKKLPRPLGHWYRSQADTGKENSWLTEIQGLKFARLPSLTWVSGVSLKMQYLIVVGEGARGTSDRKAPVAIQALSVLNAGAQLQRILDVRIPAMPFDPLIPSYLEAVAQCLEEEDAEALQKSIQSLGKKSIMGVTLLPGSNLSNSDFTGLMQALQRPLQPTLNLSVQLQLGGGPRFEPGINVDLNTDAKDRDSY
ncbi:MAG: hypothetical protein VX278_17635 [Myxococcota bacterium]|nr:hypothetical protein [Myxococcota bacterium]